MGQIFLIFFLLLHYFDAVILKIDSELLITMLKTNISSFKLKFNSSKHGSFQECC